MIDKEKYGETLDRDQLMIYVDKGLRNYVIESLMIFGVEVYYHSYFKKNLNLYLDFKDMPVEEKEKWIFDVAVNSLTTNFTLCTIFENYMKAQLLTNGAIVHLFRDSKRREKQKDNYLYYDKPQTIEMLKRDLIPDRTVGLAALLSEECQKIINLPEPILFLLNEIREPRNTLHFHHSIHYSTSDKTIEAYKEVDEFITVYVRGLLQQMMGLPPGKKNN